MLDSSSLLMTLGATSTKFFTKQVYSQGGVNYAQGFPIGNGKCKAVTLKVNALFRNVNSNIYTVLGNFYGGCIYVGDNNRQEYEVLAGIESPLIICNDLSEVWVRVGAEMLAASEKPLSIQVIVYA